MHQKVFSSCAVPGPVIELKHFPRPPSISEWKGKMMWTASYTNRSVSINLVALVQAQLVLGWVAGRQTISICTVADPGFP